MNASQYVRDSMALDRAYLQGTVKDVIDDQARKANEELDNVDDGDGEDTRQTGGPTDEAELSGQNRRTADAGGDDG